MRPTTHALQRFAERVGEGELLAVAKKSTKAGPNMRKEIAAACPRNKVTPDCDYYYNDQHLPGKRVTFVLRRTPDKNWIIKTVWVTAR
jgi:hypothetical protein